MFEEDSLWVSPRFLSSPRKTLCPRGQTRHKEEPYSWKTAPGTRTGQIYTLASSSKKTWSHKRVKNRGETKTDLLVSHSLTRLSSEPETNWCSCAGAHFTAVTQPVWEVRDSSTRDPSGEERRHLFPWRVTESEALATGTSSDIWSAWIVTVPLVRGSHSLMCLSVLPDASRRHSGE